MGKQINVDQKKAITHGRGPAMVLAGPGSGKTLVITYRIKWLIEQAGVDPSNILVITFTRAAAREMEKRFHHFQGMERANVSFGTFHSVFFMILRYAYHYSGQNIIREEQKRVFIKEAVEELEMETEDLNGLCSNLLDEISYVKGEMLQLSHYHSSNCGDDYFQKIYKKYEESLRSANLLDFDDMLVFCYELFKKRKDILQIWQNKYEYILIDEFQDINRVQYEIVKMLAGEKKNLFIVGDDDQSIYRFRGAKPEIMLGFEKDFPLTKRYILKVNYRCSQEIVNSAERLIHYNHKRFEKNMLSYRGPKVPVVYKQFENAAAECKDVVQGIKFYQRQGISLEDMAVIFRTNTQPRLLVGRLMEHNIPFQMRDVLPNIFEHWIARDLICYIRLGMGARDRATFLQVMNRPKRYISRKMIDCEQIDFAKLKREAFGKKWLYDRIDKLEMDLFLIRKMKPYAAIEYIRQGMEYNQYLVEYAQMRKINEDDLEEVINQIQESAKSYDSFEDWFQYIEEYGEELKKQLRRENQQPGVTLTTMHSSKGLEYEVVFIMDCNEGICPHKKAVKDADLEEERRLFYVAVTRAKTYLLLYTLKEMYQKEVKESPYIMEIRVDKEQFKPGRRVKHKRFGKGTVLSLTQDKISILFDQKKAKKTFALSFVLGENILEVIEDE